ncbi:hypothetical protein MHTCC0001_02100 [Flavobacteriaceae bacterium MHTCC 0001]
MHATYLWQTHHYLKTVGMKFFLVLFVVLSFVGCSDDKIDCAAVSCAVPYIRLDLIDTISQENAIIKEQLTKEDIKVQNPQNTSIEFFLNENDGSLFIENPTDEIINIYFNDDLVVNFNYDAEIKIRDCCGYLEVKGIDVNDKKIKIDNNLISIYL